MILILVVIRNVLHSTHGVQVTLKGIGFWTQRPQKVRCLQPLCQRSSRIAFGLRSPLPKGSNVVPFWVVHFNP